MKNCGGIHRIVVMMTVGLLSVVLHPFSASAQGQPYLCEIGLQGGCGYYVGDATPHIFMNVREAYGAHFRYKFTKRWAIQAKFSGQRIEGNQYTIRGEKLDSKWSNRLYNVDVMGEFNFFRFGEDNKNDKRIKPYTPYIFLGVGVGMYNDIAPDGGKKITAAGYIPLGIGFKWKFADFVGLNIAWQHNIYFSDNLEAQDTLNDKHHLNGWNWMNCDLTGMLTAGIVFEFARAPKPCRICNW
jgi:hypothetical protein